MIERMQLGLVAVAGAALQGWEFCEQLGQSLTSSLHIRVPWGSLTKYRDWNV